MTNFSKHLPYYLILLGCLCLSVGYNVVQNQEIKLLIKQKTVYKIFFEYLYLKMKKMERENLKDFVYKL